jgi:KipI family sensor histidine kinase inhibitor
MPDGATPRSVPVGEVRRMGEDALLVGVPDPESARRLLQSVKEAAFDGVVEAVGGLATVLLAFEPESKGLEVALPRLASLAEQVLGDTRAELLDEGALTPLVIPAVFDGPDLAEVAEAAGSTVEAVIDAFAGAEFTVAVVGFAPGFAYLSGLPEELRHIPRRGRPRPMVPAGSVALANGFAAVYPLASPGGWQLIGRTEVALFTPWAPPFSRLAPGDRVRFSRASGTVAGVTDDPVPPSSAVRADVFASDPLARAVFVVEEAGVRTVRQDAGRRGVAALGIPAAGPADPYSFRLANELVGNAGQAGTLEITARGPTLRCLTSTYVATVGAAPDLRLDGQPVAAGQVVPVTAGQTLVVGAVRDGFRSYLAVAGGFVGPEMFGSCARDQLTNLGPGQIEPGEQLWAGAMRPPLGDHLTGGALRVHRGAEPISLRVVPGPHPECFAAETFASLAATRFTVQPQSNRVGVRLLRDPATPALRWATGPAPALDSQGMVTGAVQVPPEGEPVILLSDHATLGGYPVVAVVAAVDRGLLGQCEPGATVVLVPIAYDHAATRRREHQRQLDAAVIGHYPIALD